MKRRTFLKNSAAATAGTIVVPTIIPSHVMGKNAPSNKIRIGQIGFGRIAMSHDLPSTLRHESSIGVAIADVDIKRAGMGKEWIEKFYADKGKANYVDVAVYQDYREMLQDKSIDAVIISTPDHWHAQPAMEAALAGKDIYLQKPASLTIKEGRQMSDTVHRTGSIFQQGSQQRGTDPWPQFHRACELVRNGRIGELEKIEIGLPGDPGGNEEPPMSVPENLDYDMWLGSTPLQYYTEKGVHPQNDFSRPGWLRLEQFGAGMITGWGAHHVDTAHWAMGTEYTGPVEVEAEASFPSSGLWNVHGDFMVHARYANGVKMQISGTFPNGVKFYGSEGWIFVSRGNVAVTSSDPSQSDTELKALDASNPKILKSEIGPDEIHLYKAPEQHEDWLNAIRSRRDPVAPAEVGHRSCSACLVSHIAMKVDGKLHWDPRHERFLDNDSANALVKRPQRYPFGTNYVL
ncbi:MAG: gfo/Idh/MocA family oxidoreductase [Bacteroidetes bacterium]|nr:MAG: gfo/Idh/MocA family oxidoreductase [Bacteroidota bacterium]